MEKLSVQNEGSAFLLLQDLCNDVLWRDEAKVKIFNQNAQHHVRGKVKHLRPTVKHGGGGLMLWACIADTRPGLCAVNESNSSADWSLCCWVRYEDIWMTAEAWTRQGHETEQRSQTWQLLYSRMAEEARIKMLEWSSPCSDLISTEIMW